MKVILYYRSGEIANGRWVYSPQSPQRRAGGIWPARGQVQGEYLSVRLREASQLPRCRRRGPGSLHKSIPGTPRIEAIR